MPMFFSLKATSFDFIVISDLMFIFFTLKNKKLDIERVQLNKTLILDAFEWEFRCYKQRKIQISVQKEFRTLRIKKYLIWN